MYPFHARWCFTPEQQWTRILFGKHWPLSNYGTVWQWLQVQDASVSSVWVESICYQVICAASIVSCRSVRYTAGTTRPLLRPSLLRHQSCGIIRFAIRLEFHPAGVFLLISVLCQIGCWMEFYTLVTFKIIWVWVLICGSAHSWWLYSASPLGDSLASSMTWYPTQSHFADTEPTSPCPIQIMLSAWLGRAQVSREGDHGQVGSESG